MPSFIILSNSSFATCSFSPNKRRGLANTGEPSVGIVWQIPCLGGEEESYDESKTSGKSRKTSAKLDCTIEEDFEACNED